MSEIKMKNFVINVGGKTYKMVGTRLEDICEELSISEDRFIELLSRDAYCPTLSAAPTSSTLTYVDTDGSTNLFHIGQLCRWAEGSDYRLAVCQDITETASAWYVLPTKVSELTNDAGYLSSHQDISGLLGKTEAEGIYQKKGDYATKSDVSTAVANKQDKVLKFENVAVSSWMNDSTYADYPYRCDMTCTGVTETMYAEVVFALEQATSGNYAPLCETKADAVSIWSASNDSITIPTILVTV